jgi:hypothetical protein
MLSMKAPVAEKPQFAGTHQWGTRVQDAMDTLMKR